MARVERQKAGDGVDEDRRHQPRVRGVLPPGTGEKRWVASVLGRKKGLGF